MNDNNLKIATIIAIDGDLSPPQCDFPFVNRETKRRLHKLFENIDENNLNGWSITLVVVYKRAINICFAKRGTSVPSDKTKEFFLRIPVPTKEQAPYGFNNKKFEYDEPPERGFLKIKPEFEKYSSLDECLIDSAQRIMEEALKHGITFNGEKIKI